jgi:hypothetical protein
MPVPGHLHATSASWLVEAAKRCKERESVRVAKPGALVAAGAVSRARGATRALPLRGQDSNQRTDRHEINLSQDIETGSNKPHTDPRKLESN